MDIQKALQAIHQGNFAPVYVLIGSEGYLATTFKQEIMKKVLAGEDDELNFAALDMEETPLSVAMEEATSVPFFGDYRLVFIEHPYFLTAEKKTGGPEHNLDELIAYIENPVPTTVLVIVANYEKLDERKKITKLIKKKTEVVDIQPLTEKALRSYLQNALQNEGYELAPDALELFLQLTDFDLAKAVSELSKLMLYRSDTKQIIKADVEMLVPKSLEHNIFDMTEYVIQGKTEKALSLYQDLLLQGEETIKINAILINQFRLLLQVKILLNQRMQKKEIADYLKVHPYRVQLAMQQCGKYSLESLGSIFDELVENDFKMKTGQMEKELLFELFLLKAK